MNENQFGGPFHLFELEISKALVARGTFSADWFNSAEGKRRINQSFEEGLPFHLCVSELELWCKGWVSQNRKETASPMRLALEVA